MTYSQFSALHSNRGPVIPRSKEKNSLPSQTDPTQDVPLSKLEFALNGMPINVKENNLPYNNLKLEDMTMIDRRHRDNFDVVGEMQQLEIKSAKTINNLKK